MEAVKNITTAPAAFALPTKDDKLAIFGGKQLEAGDKHPFSDNVRAQLAVIQNGPDGSCYIGCNVFHDHGQTKNPDLVAHYELQNSLVPVNRYKMQYMIPAKETVVKALSLPGFTAGDKIAPLAAEVVPQQVLDANKAGADLMALMISPAESHASSDNKSTGLLSIMSYPPTVAVGPNFNIVHNNAPFDDGASMSTVLSAPYIMAFIPRARYEQIMLAIRNGMQAATPSAETPFGFGPMFDYSRELLSAISDNLFIAPGDKPLPVVRQMTWGRWHCAHAYALGADSLPIQLDIEKLADEVCKSMLVRSDKGKLFVGLKLPFGQDYHKLLNELARQPTDVIIMRFPRPPWNPKSGEKKPKVEDRDPWEGRLVVDPPRGVTLPPECDLIVQVLPRKDVNDAIGAAKELSEHVPCDGKTWTDLFIQFPDETSQTKRTLRAIKRNFIPKSYDKDKDGDMRAYLEREIGKSRTRDMICGRGARKYVITPELHVVEGKPPHLPEIIDLRDLVGAASNQARTDLIEAHTIGKLGAYSEPIRHGIRYMPDGIFTLTAFPGAGKTTASTTVAIFACLVDGRWTILISAGQHAALDASNINMHKRLSTIVAEINKAEQATVHLPLIIRGFSRNRGEFAKFISIVESKYEESTDPERPNTVCEVLLQLLKAGPYRLPDHSKPVLVDLAEEIQAQNSRGYQRLRAFVAGEMTWEEASAKPSGDDSDSFNADHAAEAATEAATKPLLEPQLTVSSTIRHLFSAIINCTNILICTTSAAGTADFANFTQTANMCQIEEASALSNAFLFNAWQGMPQILMASGDPAQLQPYERDYKHHLFQDYLSVSVIDTIRAAGYPIMQLNVQYRAVNGQFDILYDQFYPEYKSIESAKDRHPSNHPDAQRVEKAFLADFDDLEASPADRILPIFIHVPDSVATSAGKSWHNPQQRNAALYAVKKIAAHDVAEKDIMVVGAYRAEIIELRRIMPRPVLVTTADSVQGKERDYVVIVFSTTKGTGARFTKSIYRLCVMLSRGKKILVLVGDIDTVDWQKLNPTNKHDTLHLENIHRNLADHKRVAVFGSKHLDIQKAERAEGLWKSAATDAEKSAEKSAEKDAVQGAEKGAEAQTDGAKDAPLPIDISQYSEEEAKLHACIQALQADKQRLEDKLEAAMRDLHEYQANKKSKPPPEDAKPMSVADRLFNYARNATSEVAQASTMESEQSSNGIAAGEQSSNDIAAGWPISDDTTDPWDAPKDAVWPIPDDTVTPEQSTNNAAPEQSPNDTVTPEQAPNDTVTPEQSPNDTVTPEQAPNDTVTPEQSPDDTVTPEQAPNDTTPEQSPNDTVTPEQAPNDTTPEQSPNNTTPEQSPNDTVTPEQAPNDTTPEQSPNDTVTPEQAPNDTTSPGQGPYDTTTPGQSSKDTTTTWQRSNDTTTTWQRSNDTTTTWQRSSNTTTSGQDSNSTHDESSMRCYNCQGMGHMSKDCTEPKKQMECYNCHQLGHAKGDCPNPKVVKCSNCDALGHLSKECPKPRDYSRIKCNRCGQFGHTIVRCKQPAPPVEDDWNEEKVAFDKNEKPAWQSGAGPTESNQETTTDIWGSGPTQWNQETTTNAWGSG